MAKKYVVCVDDMHKRVEVVLGTLSQATGLVTTNLLKGRSVEVMPYTDVTPTHRNTAAAQAFIEVELFQLVPNN